VWERTAVWRIERGPEVNSYSSSWAISYSLGGKEGWVSFFGRGSSVGVWDVREFLAGLVEQVSGC